MGPGSSKCVLLLWAPVGEVRDWNDGDPGPPNIPITVSG